MYDLLIIGAGASGLTAAITAKRRGKSVLLIEKHDCLGKKILATGNGHCNFTNQNMGAEFYHGDSAFIKTVLDSFPTDAAITYFHELGLWEQERNGYYYPFSNQAKAVVLALKETVESLDIPIEYNFEIAKLLKNEKGFSLKGTSGKSFSARKLLFASGTLDAYGKGLDSSAFPWMEMLGHSFRKPLPCLCGFNCKSVNIDFKRVSGIRVNAQVSLLVNGEKIADDYGEVQLTDYGLSGIPIFQLSGPGARALEQGKKVSFSLDFVSRLDPQSLETNLKEKSDSGKDLLNGLIPDKVGKEILYAAKQNGGDQVSAVIAMLKSLEVSALSVRDFKFAQTTSGGILTEDVNPETMESRLVPGLYFAGEILDVDGVCGGYNLHFAWATGHIVGMNI